jgi:hypothetical protein
MNIKTPQKIDVKKSTHFSLSAYFIGAGRENRTLTLLPARDFESRASTNSAIPAYSCYTLLYNRNGAIIASSYQLRNQIFTIN